MNKIVRTYFAIRREFPDMRPNTAWHVACQQSGNDFSEAP